MRANDAREDGTNMYICPAWVIVALENRKYKTKSINLWHNTIDYLTTSILHLLHSGMGQDLDNGHATLLPKFVRQKVGKPKYCPRTWACPPSCLGVGQS